MWISFCVMKEEYHSFGTFYSNKILLQVYLLMELLLYTYYFYIYYLLLLLVICNIFYLSDFGDSNTVFLCI